MASNIKKIKDGRKNLEDFEDVLRQIKKNSSKKSLTKSVERKEIWQSSQDEEIILDR